MKTHRNHAHEVCPPGPAPPPSSVWHVLRGLKKKSLSCYYRIVNPQTDRVHTVPGSDWRFYQKPLAALLNITLATFAHLLKDTTQAQSRGPTLKQLL